MSFDIAYLSQGKLYLKSRQGTPREIASQFGQSWQERRLQIQRRQAWKDRGLRSMTMPPEMIKQMESQAETVAPVAIASICQEKPGRLLYSLEAEDLGGLFRFQPESDREDRLFHSTDFRVSHLHFSPQHDLVVCSKTYPTGVVNLATLAPNLVRLNDITEGDSLDLAPRWIPGKGKALVYQSAGVSRNSQGFVVERTAFAIERLDFNQQEVVSLAADPRSDLLGPQMDSSGQLYYIRHPYRSYQQRLNWRQLVKDLLLIPIRLAYAIFQFFNSFTQMFTGQPLIAAGTQQKVERKQLRTLEGWLSLEKLSKKHAGEEDAPALVPPDWELVRQGMHGEPEVLAQGVLAYDLAEDGTVVYTNGSGIYALSPNGDRDRLCVGRLIETVAVLNSSSE